MNAEKKALLEKNGWSVGSYADFLQLTPEEETHIEMKLFFADCVKTKRKKEKLTQSSLAKKIQSSQSRVAKIESADPTVTIDLQMKALFSMGVTRKELATMMLK